MIEGSRFQLPPELVYSSTEVLGRLQSGEQLVINYMLYELFPLVRIIGTAYDTDLNQVIVSDTRQAVIIQGGCVISYSITDWHYPDKECEFGTGVWSAKPHPTDFDDLRDVEQTGFFAPDYTLTQIAIELNKYFFY